MSEGLSTVQLKASMGNPIVLGWLQPQPQLGRGVYRKSPIGDNVRRSVVVSQA